MSKLTVKDFEVGQEVVVAHNRDRSVFYVGVVTKVSEQDYTFYSNVKVRIKYEGRSREIIFKNDGTENYLYQYEDYGDRFRGHLFPSLETYSKYIQELNRVQEIKNKLDKIKSKYSVVDKLKENRVFEVYIHDEEERYSIIEKCDEYFGKEMSREDFLQLSEFFSDVANLMKENEQ